MTSHNVLNDSSVSSIVLYHPTTPLTKSLVFILLFKKENILLKQLYFVTIAIPRLSHSITL